MNKFRYPKAVIIDLNTDVANFHTVTRGMVEYEASISETLERILASIDEETSADKGVYCLSDDILHEHKRAGAGLEGAMYSRAANVLGTRLLHEIRQHGLYMPDGFLYYRFHSWLNKSTVLLVQGDPTVFDGE